MKHSYILSHCNCLYMDLLHADWISSMEKSLHVHLVLMADHVTIQILLFLFFNNSRWVMLQGN